MQRSCLKVHTASPWRLEGGHWVAPVVMVTEGVLCGSHGCQLWPGEVIQQMTHKWHDVPVSIDHPMENGTPVSINHSREVFAQHAIGVVQNPVFDPFSRALKAVIKVPQGVRGLSQIQAMKEVSIGVFTDQVREEGHFGGKRYVGRTVRATPDHLALLTGPGACDWTAGCGVRTHSGELIDELREIAGQTISRWVEDTLKGARAMHNYENESVYPPEFYQANAEKKDLEALAAWEDHPGPVPMEILELRRKYSNRGQGQGRGQGHHDQAYYPPEVV